MIPLWSQRPVRTAGECPTVIGLRAAAERIARLLAGTLPRAEWRRIDAAEWPHSSFHRFVRLGWCPPEWAAPVDIREWDLE